VFAECIPVGYKAIRRILANRNVVLGWFIRLIATHILTEILLYPSTSFMDGVSSASAVVAIVQVSFSLAQTLNTYVTDVRNGRGDIANFANEIDATATHIEELDKLIQENNITNGWNANGLKIAKKCSTVTRDDIDISIFNRLTWLAQKVRLTGLKQDLYRVKIDILLFLNIYKARVGYDSLTYFLNTPQHCLQTAFTIIQ
jgi:hypothetical protein